MGSQVLAEHDGYGTYISHSVRALSEGGIGGLLMTSSATPGTQNHQFPHYDAQGNLNGITNGGPYATASGGPFLSRTYDAYGNVTGEGQGGGLGVPGGKWGYSTKEEVAPGLLHYGARMYRPDIGRWISRDPAGEEDGANLYAFVGNDPVNFVDPYGLDALDNLSNFSAGWGDSLTFGGTKWARRGLGNLTGVGDANAAVDYCSGWYAGGATIGGVHQGYLTNGGGGRNAGPGLTLRPIGPGAGGSAFSREELKYIVRNWDKGLDRTRAVAAKKHLRKHGLSGQNLLAYTRKGVRLWKNHSQSQYAKRIILNDGRPGIKITTSDQFGIYTQGGKLISYGPRGN